MDFTTKEQHRCRIVFQAANVKRPLLAVSTRTRAGNQVSFGPHGGVIHNPKTGRMIALVRNDGIYILEILVAPPVGRSALGKTERPLAPGKAGQGEPSTGRRAPGKPVLATEAGPALRGTASPPPGQLGWQARLARCTAAEASQASGERQPAAGETQLAGQARAQRLLW